MIEPTVINQIYPAESARLLLSLRSRLEIPRPLQKVVTANHLFLEQLLGDGLTLSDLATYLADIAHVAVNAKTVQSCLMRARQRQVRNQLSKASSALFLIGSAELRPGSNLEQNDPIQQTAHSRSGLQACVAEASKPQLCENVPVGQDNTLAEITLSVNPNLWGARALAQVRDAHE